MKVKCDKSCSFLCVMCMHVEGGPQLHPALNLEEIKFGRNNNKPM